MKNKGLASKVVLSGVLAGTAASQSGCWAAGLGLGLVLAEEIEAEGRRDAARIQAGYNTPQMPDWGRPTSTYDRVRWGSSPGRFYIYPQGVRFVGNDNQWANLPYGAILDVEGTDYSLFSDDDLAIFTNKGKYTFKFPNQNNMESLDNFISSKAGLR